MDGNLASLREGALFWGLEKEKFVNEGPTSRNNSLLDSRYCCCSYGLVDLCVSSFGIVWFRWPLSIQSFDI